MRKKIMRRKAQFFSITIFIFIIVIALIFSFVSNTIKKDQEFEMDKLKVNVMAHFVETFEEVQIPEIMRASAKPALSAYLLEEDDKISKSELVDLMTSRKIGEKEYTNLNQFVTTDYLLTKVMATLPFTNNLPDDFSYSLESVEMVSDNRIKLNFLFSYELSMDDRRWSNTDVPLGIEFKIYNLPHPSYSFLNVEEDWQSTNGCFSTSIFSDAQSCTTNYNLMPPNMIIT